MKKFLPCLLIGSMCVTAAPASAKSLYFSVKGGLSHQETEIKPINAFSKTDNEDNPFGSFAIGVRSGSVRGELEYTYRQVDSETDRFTNQKYEFENQSAMYNMYFETCPYCAFSPYLSVGAGATYISSRYPGENNREVKEHKTNFIWSVGGGLAIMMTRHTNLDLGYRYLNMGRIKSEDGTKYEITNQEYYIGFRYTF